MECSNVQCIRTGGKCQSIEMDLTNQSHVRFNRWQTLPQLHTYNPRKELKKGSLSPMGLSSVSTDHSFRELGRTYRDFVSV